MTPRSPINTKREFYSLYTSGRLGNTLRVWNRPEDVPTDFRGRIMLRPLNGRGGSVPTVELPAREAVAYWKKHRAYSANEVAPDEFATLQGEVWQAPGGLYFFGRERKPEEVGVVLRMRDVLKTAQNFQGLTALLLLRKHLSPESFDNMRELLALYPDHIIEIAAYSLNVGKLLNQNTLIWEVRNY